MGRNIIGHFILMPFLIGIVPRLTVAALGSFWIGFGFMGAIYLFGPLARKRREFLTNPDFTFTDHLRFLAVMILSVMSGSLLGEFLFHRTTEVM